MLIYLIIIILLIVIINIFQINISSAPNKIFSLSVPSIITFLEKKNE